MINNLAEKLIDFNTDTVEELIGNFFCNPIKEDKNYYSANNSKDWLTEWDFKDYNPNIYSHGFHQYPAKFIPQLARKILRVFTDENSTVLDNFSGSGTTLIECFLLNRKKAIGIELNPFACFMAKVKTTPLDLKLLNNCYFEIEIKYSKKNTNYELQNFYNIEFWFKKETIVELSIIKAIVSEINNKDVQNFFLLCLSEVVRKVSFTKHSGFKLHRDKKKLTKEFNPNVYEEFKKVCTKNIILMEKFCNQVTNNKTVIKNILGDSRLPQNIESNSIDFILTSPPYGDSRTTVAYGQFSRLSWQWINNDSKISSLDNELLGGKNIVDFNNELLSLSATLLNQIELIKAKDEKRAKEVLSFYIDLFETMKNAFFYLKEINIL